MPNLTINTSAQPTTPTPTPPATATATAGATTPQSASPPRPPISPITPTLGPADKPGNEGGLGAAFPPRQTFAHAQPNQVGVPAPQPRPILFDENPDALALRSAIAVLQMQKRRAEGDIVSLHRAKEAALGDAEGFTKDLGAGRIRTGPSAGRGGDDGDDEDMDGDREEGRGNKEAKAWSELPSRQDVVRCPPINWSRYAVVGESLDRMHDEQREAPTLGVPATLGAGGAFEFKGDGDRRGFTGIAAPYTPGRDKLSDNKPKAPRR